MEEGNPWGEVKYRFGSGGTPTTVYLRKSCVLFGRGTDTDVQLLFPSASRRHFTLTRLPSASAHIRRALFQDTSRSGTLVLRRGSNRPRIVRRSSIIISNGDMLVFSMIEGHPSSLTSLDSALQLVFVAGNYRPHPFDAAPNQQAFVPRDGALFEIDLSRSLRDLDRELQLVMTPPLPTNSSSNGDNGRISAAATSANPVGESAEQGRMSDSSETSGGAANSAEDAAAAASRLGELENFVTQVADIYMCSICMEFAYDPVTSAQCLHVFCGGCLSRWMFRASGPRTDCPKCRTSIEVVMPSRECASIFSSIVKIRPSADRTDDERALLDEQNSFRGHSRFVVQDHIRTDLAARLRQSMADSGDDTNNTSAASPSPRDDHHAANSGRRRGDEIGTGGSGGRSAPGPFVARLRRQRRHPNFSSNFAYAIGSRHGRRNV